MICEREELQVFIFDSLCDSNHMWPLIKQSKFFSDKLLKNMLIYLTDILFLYFFLAPEIHVIP
jgi:hypothetical protein